MGQNNKKTISLGLDYSQLDSGVTEINRKMKLLDAEFRAASEEMKSYGEQSDHLELKQQQLTEKINLQAQKVKLSKEAYEKALSSGTATNKQLDNLQIAYNNNQTTLSKLNNELIENNKRLDEVSKQTEAVTEKTSSFGDSIRGMSSTLGLEVSPALENVASKFDGISSDVGNAIIGIGGIITSFASASINSANFADDLLQLSSVTGLTTDELQKMSYASDFLDVEVETMTGSITKLTRNMNDARNGSEDLEKAFETLRVKYKDNNGELRNAQDVFYETIDALSKVENETERDSLAMELMGKSAKELNPLIEAGSDRLKELGIEASDMGTIMGGESLDKLGKLKDAMDKFENTTGALKNSLGVVLLPVITALFESISKIPTPVLSTLVVLASVIATIILVVKAIKSMTDTASTVKDFFDGTNTKAIKTTGIILAVVAALIALAAIIAVIAGRGKDLQSSLDSVGSSVERVTNSVNTTQSNTVSAIGHANGTKNFQGGETWVGEAGAELVRLPKVVKYMIIMNQKL